jgi:superfamily II DNA or RNA helicase
MFGGIPMGRSKRDLESFRKSLAKRKKEMMEIASAIARQTGFSIRGEKDSRPSPPPADVKSPSHRTLRKWSDACNDMLGYHDRGFRFLSLSHGQSLKVHDVYEKGLVTAEFTDRRNIYRLFASPGSMESRCNCQRLPGRVLCEHLIHLLKRIQQDLNDPTSELSKRILDEHWSTNPFDLQAFTYDSSVESLRELAALCSSLQTLDADQGLPGSSNTTEVRRIAWNIDLRTGFEIDCLIQTMNKRGTGWKRGQRIPVTQIFDDSLPLSPADKRLRSHMVDDYAGTHLKPVLAIHELVGAENVLLDNDPVSVFSIEPIVAVESKGPSNHFGFVLQSQGKSLVGNLMYDPDGILSVSQNRDSIGVCLCPESVSEALLRLIKLEPVREQYVSQLIDHARKLQSVLSIKLPEHEAGTSLTEPLRPLIVLRASPEGRLDYGIRVRDASEKLQRPGQGRMVRSDSLEGKPVQRVRSGHQETRDATDLAATLKLPHRNWDGECPDLYSSVQLLTRLRDQSQELEVLWDPATASRPRFAGTIAANNVQVKIEKKRDWFQLSGVTLVGDHSIPLASLIEASGQSRVGEEGNFLVRLKDDTWAEISNELHARLDSLQSAIHTERGAIKFDRSSARQIRELQSALTVDAPKVWLECLERLERAEHLDPQLPTELNATLREYQAEGFRWMRRLAEWGVGGILADDMGLGKTVQTLAVILDRASEGPCLVIAPTSVAFNWMREIQRFAPSLQAHLYRETDRDDFLLQLGPGQVVVCSYGLALRDAGKLKEVGWHTMVLDEAQAIKNSRSKTSQAISSIPADWTIALTGTPVENHLGELWSLFHVVSPGIFGGWEHFRNRFAGPIEKNDDQDRREALRQRLQPFVLRRTKGEVLRDLPPRTESNLYVELSPEERKRYDQVRLSTIAEAMSIAKLPDIQDQRFKILALLTRLRQLACNPKLVDEHWQGSSAKLDLLRDTLKELQDEGHRVLVFSQFVQHLQLIREMLDQEKISYQYLDGSTPPDQRTREVDSFQNGNATVFLISLKAGGTGLNLTAADYVIHMDPWWNPAVEDQATDRAHRIGQTKPVIVYRIIAQGTIEEEILKLHDTKRDLIAGVLEGAQAAAKLSTQDLIAMIKKDL